MVTPQQLLQRYLDDIKKIDLEKYGTTFSEPNRIRNKKDITEIKHYRNMYAVAIKQLELLFHAPKIPYEQRKLNELHRKNKT